MASATPIHKTWPEPRPRPSLSASTLERLAKALILLSYGLFGLGASYITSLLPIQTYIDPCIPSPLSSLLADHHYKYLIPMLLPVTAWFAIANWVGWEYFLNS